MDFTAAVPHPLSAPSAEDEEELMCRYCFDGEEEGELLSPCNCSGGQKWVHLACLRRWQRMVLVQQPTHPAFYAADARHYRCSSSRRPLYVHVAASGVIAH